MRIIFLTIVFLAANISCISETASSTKDIPGTATSAVPRPREILKLAEMIEPITAPYGLYVSVQSIPGGLVLRDYVRSGSREILGLSIMETWSWDGSSLKKGMVSEKFVAYNLNFVSKDKYLQWEQYSIVLRALPKNEKLKVWESPRDGSGLWALEFGACNSGKFAAVTANTSLYDDNDTIILRPAIIDLTTLELQWLPQRVLGKAEYRGNPGIHSVAVTNDCRFLSVGGFAGQATVFDVAARKVLWGQCPKDVISLQYTAFSSDGSKVYAAGDWLVLCYDTLTGKELRRWPISRTGKQTYGYRATSLAVSPDDRWIAAGTGPTGDTYLIDTKTEKQTIFPHGVTTSELSFSPDSKYLATSGGNTIQIWTLDK